MNKSRVIYKIGIGGIAISLILGCASLSGLGEDSPSKKPYIPQLLTGPWPEALLDREKVKEGEVVPERVILEYFPDGTVAAMTFIYPLTVSVEGLQQKLEKILGQPSRSFSSGLIVWRSPDGSRTWHLSTSEESHEIQIGTNKTIKQR